MDTTDTQHGPSLRRIAAPEVKTRNHTGMTDITDVLAQSISAILFASYGLYALLSKRMEAEFKRYGLAHFRTLTGVLQLAGSIGLMVGHFYRPLLLISAGGFTVMMFLAVITRFKIKDPLYAALPAFALGVLNCFIFATAL